MIRAKALKGKGGRESIHSDSFRIQVALEYLDGSFSQSQIEKKYGLAEKSVYRFVNWYKENQIATMDQHPPEQEICANSSADQRALEKKLALAELKIAAREKVIAMANHEYNTDLKKKLLPSDG